jgi:CubicO group peptidase (beta-lactamase class C family)
MPFEVLLRTRIFEPLGMHGTACFVDEGLADGAVLVSCPADT